MSRKDYVIISEVFNNNRPGENWDANKRVQWNLLVKDMASALKSDNNAFKPERFMDACGGLFDV